MHIALKDVHKHFGPVRANNGVSLTIAPGTIHGLLGENGAGKSTLVKILSGYHAKTSGEILFDGRPADLRSPAHAAGLGVGMVYQDPHDFPNLTVLDNFMLGQRRGLSLGRKACREQMLGLCDRLSFCLPPSALVRDLTIGERQQLEMLRLLGKGIEVLILDEPTTGISSLQKDILFATLKKLAAEGKSVILVSHKLEDVEALCDKVTVLRQGRTAGEMERPFSADAVLAMMFGKPVSFPARTAAAAGEPLLKMKNVWAAGGRTGLQDCTAEVRRGEIIALAGLEGSGQGVFLRTAAGLQAPIRGEISTATGNGARRTYHDLRREGAVFLPGSRLEEGLIPGMTIADHFALQDASGWFFLNRGRAVRTAENRIRNFRIKGAPDTPVDALSGGNQQRLLLSFLPQRPSLLLLENPTRGLDTASANWVWKNLQTFAQGNAGVVFSSPELDEILLAAHRVLVFFEGRIIRDVNAADTDVSDLGRAIAGKA